MILFINACVRSNSRTRRLADRVLSKWNEPITEIRLHETEFPVTDEAYLDRRNRLIEAEDYSDPMFALARQFASADRIVIAAPAFCPAGAKNPALSCFGDLQSGA